jgi:hypothetical protein
MALFSSLIYWVIFVVAIFVVVSISFITGIVACFRPCCVTRTVKDPEGDNLISSGMQTEDIVEEENETQRPLPPLDEPEDVIFVTKHSNNKFSVDRRKSTIGIRGANSNGTPLSSSNRIYPILPNSPIQMDTSGGIIIPQSPSQQHQEKY